MIDLEKIAKEHEKLFERADFQSQLIKYEEERKEYHEALNHLIEELADRMIVCCGIYRFAPKVAEKRLKDCYDKAIHFGIVQSVEAEVNRKWQINLKRKWAWNGKTYHHVGDDEC